VDTPPHQRMKVFAVFGGLLGDRGNPKVVAGADATHDPGGLRHDGSSLSPGPDRARARRRASADVARVTHPPWPKRGSSAGQGAR